MSEHFICSIVIRKNATWLSNIIIVFAVGNDKVQLLIANDNCVVLENNLLCRPKKGLGLKTMCSLALLVLQNVMEPSRPQCFLCNVKLSSSSFVPAKLKEHFKKVHGSGKYKDTTLEELKQKRARYDAKSTITTYDFVHVGKPILTASYEVAYLIAKQGKPHTIGETLVKPAALQLANIMLGKAAKDKLSLAPLSNNVVSSRINDRSEDIFSQVVEKLKTSPTKFSLQLDETTDVANFNQLLTAKAKILVTSGLR